ncbi:MAG: DUF3267 domain-containing protein [Bacteroidales bacterium]
MAGQNNPDIEDLHNNSKYRLVKVLKHKEVVFFVVRQLKILKWPMLFFYIFILALFIMMAAVTAHNIIYHQISWGSYWIFMFYGVFSGMILIIPFHEALHGLAYRCAGAKKVKYGMDLKQMLFYASAPGFVADKKAFLLVALFPFLIINLFFAAGIAFGQPEVKWASLTALFVHSTLCIGDFAMINFLASFPGSGLFTYDDQSTKTSYFFTCCTNGKTDRNAEF